MLRMTSPRHHADSCPAVIVGCGLAGIAAAAALRQGGHSVVVLEQDNLPRQPVPRRRVPQAGHLHNLLTRGQIHMEELLPGFRRQLRAAGAREVPVAAGTRVFEFGTAMPARDLGLRILCAPRPLIEHVARRLLQHDGSVRIREGVRVEELELSHDNSVAGVVLSTGAHRERVETSLVVDASGIRTEGTRWLQLAGIPAPRVDRRPVSRWYTTEEVKRPAFEKFDRSWMVFPTPPHTRSGIVSPLGTDRWHISLSGVSGDPPPRSWIDVRAYAETLEVSWIAELLDSAEPVGEPRVFRRPFATWHRYDLQEEPVAGLLPIGDALMCLDPLLGQGMSVAAWHASILAEALARTNHRSAPADITMSYLSRATTACHSAWELEEIAMEQRARAEMRELGAELARDLALHRRYVSAWHLTERATAIRDAFAALRT
jgi:2-polyprenyl-6-methoxyphenol hydroxylase-like FAD-dependent oxidoreductase